MKTVDHHVGAEHPEITVVVATFGDAEWIHLARNRAIPSALGQADVVHAHADTLAQARNAGLEAVETDFVIHLDADDELEVGYVEAMAAGSADLRVPFLRQMRGRREGQPFLPQVWSHTHECSGPCLRNGNWIIIGACVRAQILRDVGGWEEWGWSEDWAAWARCWQAGASIEVIRDAIYRAHVSMDSRNHNKSADETLDWHRQIELAVFGEVTV